MDSEDDMLDAHDMESGDDDYYSGGTDDYNDSDGDEPDFAYVEEDVDDSAMIASRRSQVGLITRLTFPSTSCLRRCSFFFFLELIVFRTCYVSLAF